MIGFADGHRLAQWFIGSRDSASYGYANTVHLFARFVCCHNRKGSYTRVAIATIVFKIVSLLAAAVVIMKHLLCWQLSTFHLQGTACSKDFPVWQRKWVLLVSMLTNLHCRCSKGFSVLSSVFEFIPAQHLALQ